VVSLYNGQSSFDQRVDRVQSNYLQSHNPNVPNIPLKLKVPGSRKLTAAKKVWKELLEHERISDIYTRKTLTLSEYEKHGNLSIDHFIPWSFESHDEFWNLCPTFKNVNSSKNDMLPKLDIYLDEFCEIHYIAVNCLKESKKHRKIYEDYYTIANAEMQRQMSLEGCVISKEVVEESLRKVIVPIHQIAENQGFKVWKGEYGKNSYD